MKMPNRGKRRFAILRIVVIYATFGTLWIYLSDALLQSLIHDPIVMTRIAMFKGLLFIVATASLLYFLINRYVSRLVESNRQLQASDALLRERTALLKATIESLPFEFFALDTTGRYFMGNSTTLKNWGNVIGKRPDEMKAQPDQIEKWLDKNRRALNGETIIEETAYDQPEGRRFFVENLAPIKDENGDILGIIGMNIDQTEQKMALDSLRVYSERLRLSEEKFSTAFRISPDSININQLSDGKYLEVNEGFTAISGFTPEEIIGKTSLETGIWVNPEDREFLVRELKAHGIVKNLEAKFRCKDGSIIIGQMSARAIDLGGLPCLLNITRDITEHKLAEQALRESEENLKSLLELMPVGVGWSKGSGEIEYVNRNFVERFGYTHAEIPTVEDWYDLAYPDPSYREKLVECWNADRAEAGAHGTLVPPRDAMVTCKDGSVRHVIVNTQITRNRTLVIFTDITERENSREELLRTQKLESLGVLAGGIAHDFNNVLTGILGNVSFAQMLLDPAHKAFKPLQEAEKAANRAAELAHQLLTFAKGGQPITRAVSARQIVDESVSLVLRGSNVRGVVEIPDSVHAIMVDEGQISQAFNNIIINAVQAMSGGGKITIRARNVTIDKKRALLVAPGKYVKFTFGDTGCGIPDEEQTKIFDPYFTTKPAGTGLGLASVHSIISKHGGHIGVHSVVGKGTNFDILLPSTGDKPPGPVTFLTAQAAGRHAGGSILVMDDEEMIRNLAAGMLGELGYRVETCRDGKEAISMYKDARKASTPYSAVVMDLTIPGGMGGKEAAQRILALDPKACLIVSSGYSNDPVMAEYRTYGFCGCVNKPYQVAELVQLLNRNLPTDGPEAG